MNIDKFTPHTYHSLFGELLFRYNKIKDVICFDTAETLFIYVTDGC